jgi:hypothetical protein
VKKTVLFFATSIILTAFLAGCSGGPKVTKYTQEKITSIAWAGDTLIAYSKSIERGFIANGIKRNPMKGTLDTTYQEMEIPDNPVEVAFFPGGDELLFSSTEGIWRVNLTTGKKSNFFVHPSINKQAEEINVGPSETYIAIVVDADGMPGTEKYRDLFLVETKSSNLVFHTDSLIDAKSFAWSAEDCIVFIQPDPREPGKTVILQFGVHDCTVKPSDFTEEQVRCNCPQPQISGSGMWVASDSLGRLDIQRYKVN